MCDHDKAPYKSTFTFTFTKVDGEPSMGMPLPFENAFLENVARDLEL